MGSFTDSFKTSTGMAIRLPENPSGVRLAHKCIPEHPHTYCTIYVAIFEWKIFQKNWLSEILKTIFGKKKEQGYD